ncbi:FecCD family ABC transporter permease [Leucobacter sp. NPDC058333]|uniref:FecCD family ABC transporter permease n=1 Tax=Leucobacter sp. NPDC058333 TaxID=3346450 RepID=UPI003656BA27
MNRVGVARAAGLARPARPAQLRRGPSPRALTVRIVLAVLTIACVIAALALGSRELDIGRVFAAFGPGADELDRMVVVEWRAPRALAAVLFGACLGVSGAIFQTLTRNPLGSPDIVGLNTGAYTGVVVVMMLGGTGFALQATGALLGGLIATAIIYLLAFRKGLSGFRLIIVGIAVSAMLTSVNTWFSVKSDLDAAARAAVWGAGSLGGIEWPVMLAAVVVFVPMLLLLPLASWRLRQLELGDDTAASLGVPVESSKVFVVAVGVALTALATTVAGPIAFVSLAATPIATRLTGRTGSSEFVGAALVGALLLSVSDLIAQHALPHATLPVGAVTVCLGGAYLVWLLFRESAR